MTWSRFARGRIACKTDGVGVTRDGLNLGQELDLRVAEARGQLSPNDERLAGFVRDHLQELAFHTAESLAQGAGVSAAAVVRFARRLGFGSFRELRDAARSELRPDQTEELSAPSTSTLERKSRQDISSLELLPRLLGEVLPAAASTVAAAGRVWLLANRETYGLAVYAYRLMHQVRRGVHLIDPSYPDAVRDLGSADVVIACTFRPYASQTVTLLARARSAGAAIVLLTDGLAHEFSAPSDIVLAVPVDSPTVFLSFTPAVCALETLAALVARLDVDETYETLDSTATFVDEHQLTVDNTVAYNEMRRRRNPA